LAGRVVTSVALFDALAFAVEAHGRVGHLRKGTRFPYVIHPIRVAWTLERHGYDDEVITAGLLHDTIEDTDVTAEEIAGRFGERVARLVRAVSEADKTASWEERKSATIEKVAAAEDDVLAILAADKLDNVRATSADLAEGGEEATWAKFKAGRDEQGWYYRTLADSFVARDPENPLFATLHREVASVFPD
jgi:(p)ppGpp synthase/HD superfamily hydrolase